MKTTVDTEKNYKLLTLQNLLWAWETYNAYLDKQEDSGVLQWRHQVAANVGLAFLKNQFERLSEVGFLSLYDCATEFEANALDEIECVLAPQRILARGKKTC